MGSMNNQLLEIEFGILFPFWFSQAANLKCKPEDFSNMWWYKVLLTICKKNSPLPFSPRNALKWLKYTRMLIVWPTSVSADQVVFLFPASPPTDHPRQSPAKHSNKVRACVCVCVCTLQCRECSV